LRLSELASCGFDFVNPLDLETSAFVGDSQRCVFAWRVEDTVDSVLFLVVEGSVDLSSVASLPRS